MFDRKFLEEFGLYRKHPLKVQFPLLLKHDPPRIQRHCPTCGGERTFHPIARARVGRHCILGANYSHDADDNPLLGSAFGYEYMCGSCDSHERAHFILYFGIEGYTRAQFCDTNEKQIAAYSLTKDARCYVMKIGQCPPWSIEPPDELRHALRTHEDIYKRGTICESQGYGIGAFAYYRRIIEGIIDELLNDISELLPDVERKQYQAALAEITGTIVAQDKIAVVKDMLPATLRPGGINPLGTLHDALSVGLHDLDEDDCLSLADGIRNSLSMLARHIVLAKQDKDEYAKSIAAVRGTLDKIRKRKVGAAKKEPEPEDKELKKSGR